MIYVYLIGIPLLVILCIFLYCSLALGKSYDLDTERMMEDIGIDNGIIND